MSDVYHCCCLNSWSPEWSNERKSLMKKNRWNWTAPSNIIGCWRSSAIHKTATHKHSAHHAWITQSSSTSPLVTVRVKHNNDVADSNNSNWTMFGWHLDFRKFLQCPQSFGYFTKFSVLIVEIIETTCTGPKQPSYKSRQWFTFESYFLEAAKDQSEFIYLSHCHAFSLYIKISLVPLELNKTCAHGSRNNLETTRKINKN